MKKLMLSLAAMSLLAFAGINAETVKSVDQVMVQETTKIDPESLPEKVKEAIQNDEAVKNLKIKEAHQVMEDAAVFYLVKFEGETPEGEVEKKYDNMGKEVKEEPVK
ncbi:hypothetical protein SAMN04488057_104329 [Cyclobacterium lianum]|uniref:Peptidase propeptide and YPEB domain-containing protein n=1 Tax=Cyclobacterium lianum TaxID=388280 RepID=A0A1M7MJB6_9BACT|nr:hypothetical protein [Cyclobacterium lianum]SHM90933.1 hypothetical protein SAMN04488057_104329 [Cyclobacterium lianum]